MIAYANGTLTAITARGTTADYDVPEALGATRWAGSVGVTVREELLEDLSGGNLTEVKQTRVEIPYPVGSKVVRGDTLTYIYEAALGSITGSSSGPALNAQLGLAVPGAFEPGMAAGVGGSNARTQSRVAGTVIRAQPVGRVRVVLEAV